MNRTFTTFLAQVSLGALLVVGSTGLDIAFPVLSSRPAVAEEATNARKRIAVMDFDYGNTSSSYYYSYRGVGAAKGISEILINELVNEGTYTVVDRSRLEQAMQDNNMSGSLSTADAVKLGKQLGVDAVVVGTVTRFNVDTESSSGSFFGVSGGSKKTKAYVQVDTRLISTDSGDILGTARGQGESSSRGGRGSVFGVGGSSSESNEDKLLTEAVDQAIQELVGDMAKASSRL